MSTYSLPPMALPDMRSKNSLKSSPALAWCTESLKSLMRSQLARTSSGVRLSVCRKRPLLRSQRKRAWKPPPTSNTPPVSWQSSCTSQPTSGATSSERSLACISSGNRPLAITRREAAIGAMVLTRMFLLAPSMARVLLKPIRPDLAVE
ncbi:hypothetical protein FQZ97_1086050 [compost metagenome]